MCNFNFSSRLLNIFRGGPPKNKFNWHANEYLNLALISEIFKGMSDSFLNLYKIKKLLVLNN